MGADSAVDTPCVRVCGGLRRRRGSYARIVLAVFVPFSRKKKKTKNDDNDEAVEKMRVCIKGERSSFVSV